MRSLNDLLDSIMSATTDDRLKWSEEGRRDYFVAELSNYQVTIGEWFDDRSEGLGITIELKDPVNGKILDTVQADQFNEMYSELGALFNAARRSAYGVSDIISELEGVLKAKKSSK
jgi:hypothetical protein